MADTFYITRITEETIENKKYLCFHILVYEKDLIVRIFKKQTEELIEKSQILNPFDNVSQFITFVIKHDNKDKNKQKIVLDINI